MSVDPNNLEPGIDYMIAKKVPLMPHPNPSGTDSLKLLNQMRWLKSSTSFRVGKKEEHASGTWYPVTRIGESDTAHLEQKYWINRNALCGAILLPLNRCQEVSDA